METLRVRLKGESPLIVQKDTLADPLDPMTIRLKELTSVKTKTVEHHKAIARIEFEAALYMDDEGPFAPADMVQKCLVEGARLEKAGKSVERGVLVVQNMPLRYDGPRTVEGLYAKREHIYRKSVVVGGKSRTIRVRPIFPVWFVEADIAFDDRVIERKALIRIAGAAGNYIGIGSRRPNRGGSFGRFAVEVVQ